MARVKRGPHRKEKRKRVLKLAKGYYGKKKNAYRIAKQAVDRALKFAYRDRRQKKREFRKLWIVRINAASRANGLSYNRLIDGLRRAGLDLNRKILADIAVHDTEGFAAIVEVAKEGLEMEPVERPAEPVSKPIAKPKPAPKAKPAPKKEAKPAPKKEAKPTAPEKKVEKKAEKPAAEKPAKKKAAAPKAEAPSKADLGKMTVADLKKLADERGISEGDIEGSGAGGNVVKADWVRVLAG